jgi:hypothetical protein
LQQAGQRPRYMIAVQGCAIGANGD